MSIGDRVKQKRTELGLTQAELANLIGITQQSLQKIEDGRTQNPRKLLNLSKVLNSDPEWLLLGTKSEIRETNSHYNGDNTSAQKNTNLRPLINDYQAVDLPLSKHLKIDQTEWLYSPPNASEDAFWLTAVGDSMTSSSGLSVPENYLILVEPNLTAENGDLVIAKISDSNEVTFKKFVTDTGKTYLKPLNANYRPTEVTMNFRIIGVVVEARSTFINR